MGYPGPAVRAAARGERVPGALIDFAASESALEHRMAAILLESIDDVSAAQPEALAALNAYDMAVAAQRRRQDLVFESVHQTLSQHDLTHTFVKGPVSAIRWFETPTQRPYSDIDVVIPAQLLASAVTALDPTHEALEVFEDRRSSAAVTSVQIEIDGVKVDLQTDALRTGLPSIDVEGWNRGESVLTEDNPIPVFSNEHDMVVFLLHQGRDRFRFLLGVAEVRSRLGAEIDWGRVEMLARREGVWDQVAVALEVMCDELGHDPPVSAPGGWRVRLWRRLWRKEVRLLGEVGRIKHVVRGRWLMPLTMRGRMFATLGILVRSVFPPDAVLRLRYPDSNGPYLWRVFADRFRTVGRRRIWVLRHQRR